jgi:hypothetical protein
MPAERTTMTRKVWAVSAFSALTLAFATLAPQQIQAHIRSPEARVSILGDMDGATAGPTAKSALSTDEAINQAMLTSDTGALKTLLADGWVVVSGFGGIADKSGFIEFIREGGPRKKMILSEPRVRIYGDTALVTTHLSAAGPFVKEVNGKLVRNCFDVKERQTDVLVWKNGAWRSVLLHETIIPPGAKLGCS